MAQSNVKKDGRYTTYEDILEKQLAAGVKKYNTHNRSLFVSSIAAGLEVGFSFLMILLVIASYGTILSDVNLKFALGLAYSVGFLFVVLGKSLLFTEHTAMAVMPVLKRERSLNDLLNLWSFIYFGNLLGGLFFSIILYFLGDSMNLYTPEMVGGFAKKICKFGFPTIVGSAMIAGWLMALLSWILSASKDTISKIAITIIITFFIGVGGFHHCIVGFIEIFTGFLKGYISVGQLLSVQVASTIGNILGGVIFVALIKYGQYVEPKEFMEIYPDEEKIPEKKI